MKFGLPKFSKKELTEEEKIAQEKATQEKKEKIKQRNASFKEFFEVKIDPNKPDKKSATIINASGEVVDLDSNTIIAIIVSLSLGLYALYNVATGVNNYLPPVDELAKDLNFVERINEAGHINKFCEKMAKSLISDNYFSGEKGCAVVIDGELRGSGKLVSSAILDNLMLTNNDINAFDKWAKQLTVSFKFKEASNTTTVFFGNFPKLSGPKPYIK